MFPKFRRTRIRNLEPATLAELKQYIDSRLVPPEGDALGDTVRLDEFREPSAPSEDLQASREAVTFDTASAFRAFRSRTAFHPAQGSP